MSKAQEPSVVVVRLMLVLTVSLLPLVAAAQTLGSVSPKFDLAEMGGSPFPTDLYTVLDASQVTGHRVDLPKPVCSLRPSDCKDIDVLNKLDGFNLQPRLAIPFSGAIDVNSVNSSNVFLIALPLKLHDDADKGKDGDGGCDGKSPGESPDPSLTTVGINRIVWDPDTNTLYVESDILLSERAPYALIVSTDVLDSAGDPIVESTEFKHYDRSLASDQHQRLYRRALKDALHAACRLGTRRPNVAVASVFTTQSISPSLENMRDYVRSLPAPQADFLLGPGGARTVFALSSIKAIANNQQVGVDPPTFTTVAVNRAIMDFVPGAVGTIGYGRISATSFLQPDQTMADLGTKGVPPAVGTQDIYFNVYLPSGAKPAAGWPVLITGIGTQAVKDLFNALWASELAHAGFALVAINPYMRGRGPLSTTTITRVDNSKITFLAGGRGVDMNNNNVYELAEDDVVNNIAGARDTTKQTVIDLVQMAQAIEAGIDVDGDGSVDLDASQIKYIGWSFGANYGAIAVALDAAFKGAVLNAPGGAIIDNRRLSPAGRASVGAQLAARVPSLINLSGTNFNENLPLRNVAPVVNTVPGAIPIQEFLDRKEWATQASESIAWAGSLQGTSVLVQIAKGDQTVANPDASAFVRAGGLAAQTTFYRHDLAFKADPARPKDPHQFLTLLATPSMVDISRVCQEQAAQFLATGVVGQPTPTQFFEVPIPLPLPETLNFIP